MSCRKRQHRRNNILHRCFASCFANCFGESSPPPFANASVVCFHMACSICLRQSSSSTNALESRQPGCTFTYNSRNTLVPNIRSNCTRAPVPIFFIIWPCLPTRIPFCPSRYNRLSLKCGLACGLLQTHRQLPWLHKEFLPKWQAKPAREQSPPPGIAPVGRSPDPQENMRGPRAAPPPPTSAAHPDRCASTPRWELPARNHEACDIPR